MVVSEQRKMYSNSSCSNNNNNNNNNNSTNHSFPFFLFFFVCIQSFLLSHPTHPMEDIQNEYSHHHLFLQWGRRFDDGVRVE